MVECSLLSDQLRNTLFCLPDVNERVPHEKKQTKKLIDPCQGKSEFIGRTLSKPSVMVAGDEYDAPKLEW